MGVVSSPTAVTIQAASTAPAWFAALANKQSIQPALNTIASQAPSPLPTGTSGHASVIHAWNGMAGDSVRKKLWMLGNGGHSDYAGNEVYEWDFATRLWTRRRDPSASITGNNTKYPDGRPSSDHSASTHVCAEGRLFRLGMCSVYSSGFENGHQWWEYSPDAGSVAGRSTISGAAHDWIDLGNGHSRNKDAVNGLAIFDPSERRLIKIYGDNIVTPGIEWFDLDGALTTPVATNGAWQAYSGTPCAAVDTTNGILLIKGGSSSTHYWVRLSAKGTLNSISPTGTPPGNAWAIYWWAPWNCFVTWDGAGNILKGIPVVSGGGYQSFSWTTTPISSGPIPSIESGLAGMYNKINLVDMGDGTAALCILSRYSGLNALTVIKLSGTG